MMQDNYVNWYGMPILSYFLYLEDRIAYKVSLDMIQALILLKLVFTKKKTIWKELIWKVVILQKLLKLLLS